MENNSQFLGQRTEKKQHLAQGRRDAEDKRKYLSLRLGSAGEKESVA